MVYYIVEWMPNYYEVVSQEFGSKNQAFKKANYVWNRQNPSSIRILEIDNEDYRILYSKERRKDNIRIGKLKGNGKAKCGYYDNPFSDNN